jgi:hypothetical protein
MADHEDEDFVREEEKAAAEEARRIGGRAGDEDLPPDERPLSEAGEGEAEGFELAEKDLIDHAEDQEGEGTPRFDELGEEEEPDPATYGEADEEEKPDE